MARSHSSSGYYNRRIAQTVHIDEKRREIYNTSKTNHVDQPSELRALTGHMPLNKLFAEAFDYQKDRLIKKSQRNDDNVANKLNKMSKKTAVRMKDQSFSGQAPVSIIVFLQDFQAECDNCNIHEGAAI